MSDFLESHQKGMKTLGFWSEDFKATIMAAYELRVKTEIIREWTIVDLIINADKILIKWVPRFRPLTNEELKEQYGRTDI